MTPEEKFILQRATRTKPKRLKKVKAFDTPVTEAKKGNPYAHTRTGYREDLGIVLRSAWEANICRIMTSFGIDYEFEPRVFKYPVLRGNKAYVPDFWLPGQEEGEGDWVEVKGYLDQNSKVKLKRFKKYYPEEFARLTLISGGSKDSVKFFKELGVRNLLFYGEFRKLYKNIIRNWEGS